jgi:hypothetical protein
VLVAVVLVDMAMMAVADLLDYRVALQPMDLVEIHAVVMHHWVGQQAVVVALAIPKVAKLD